MVNSFLRSNNYPTKILINNFKKVMNLIMYIKSALLIFFKRKNGFTWLEKIYEWVLKCYVKGKMFVELKFV